MYFQNACELFNVWNIDYEKKLPKMLLREGEHHFRTWLFDALPYVPDTGATSEQKARRERKRAFFEALRFKEGIVVEEGVVRPKKTVCYNCQSEFSVPVQKLVDVKISVCLTSLAWSRTVDKIVLLAGDRDLLPAVEAALPTKVTIRLAYFSEGNVMTSKDLIMKCPEKHPLTGTDLATCVL
jgi:hypothetical protein